MNNSQQIDFIINSNQSLFGIKLLDIIDGKDVYSKPSKHAFEEAVLNVNIFKARQLAINDRTKISAGDWVLRKNGELSRITVYSDSCKAIQVGGLENSHGFFMSKSGGCTYSGGCGDCLSKDKLVLTKKTKKGLCWIFSKDNVGAHRGVYNYLMFKVWKEI